MGPSEPPRAVTAVRERLPCVLLRGAAHCKGPTARCRNGVYRENCGRRPLVTAPYSSLTSRPGCGDTRTASPTSFCGPSCLLRFRVPDGLGEGRERIGCLELRVDDLFLVRCSTAQPRAPTNVFHFHPDLQQVVQSENPGRPGCLDAWSDRLIVSDVSECPGLGESRRLLIVRAKMPEQVGKSKTTDDQMPDRGRRSAGSSNRRGLNGVFSPSRCLC